MAISFYLVYLNAVYMLENILVVTRYGSDKAVDVAVKVIDMLRSIVDGVTIHTVNPLFIEGTRSIDEHEVKRIRFDLAITIGGDGTILRASRWLNNPTPILAIKLPTSKGILAEVTVEGIDDVIPRLLKNNYHIERRMRIIPSVNGTPLQPALNEVFIVRDTLTKTPTYKLGIIGYVLSYRMDGLIVATPTGSTGHSLSLGGPIVYELMESILLTPLAPIGNLPCMVLPSDAKIEVECNADVNLVIDGQVVSNVKQGSIISIARYEHDAHFLRFYTRGMKQLASIQ